MKKILKIKRKVGIKMSNCCDEKKLEANFKDEQVDLSLLDETLNELSHEKGNLISILQKAQDIYGYLPLSVLKYISAETGVKRATIYGVATFYTQFRLNPIGKYLILQCQGTACHVNGSDEVSRALREELKITPGETTPDGIFTLENVACLGCCSLAPVMMINGEAYGKLTPAKATKIIRDIYKKEREGEKNEN
ncbi:NADH-quinone oxidoreductase subunit NuoE [Acidilutibacter cellobiosedens]|jgi:NADH-quinone oxidoreductase subunit E|nr:NADH-quinone oxidoreductase subunit NuoE [Acidilutibacter cellobiosedens]